MRRIGAVLVSVALVVLFGAAPASAVAPDRYGDAVTFTEDLAFCDGFTVTAVGDFSWEGKVFYDRNGTVDRVTEKYKADFLIHRIDLDGSMSDLSIREKDAWTNIYYPDQLTNVSHGVAYNTVVPGYGPVYKWAGNVEWYWDADFNVIIVENHGWLVIPFDATATAVLCEYFG